MFKCCSALTAINKTNNAIKARIEQEIIYHILCQVNLDSCWTSACIFLGNIFNIAVAFFLGLRECVSLSHPASSVPKAELKFTLPWFIA